MRMPRFRLSIRWMMGLVALVALMIWAKQMRERSIEYQARAAEHAAGAESRALASSIWQADANKYQKIADYSRVRTDRPEGIDWIKDAEHWDEQAAIHRGYVEMTARQSAYHADLAGKYRRAARYPWLSVAPDPPYPQ